MKDLEDYMDHREKRIAFAFMVVEAKRKRRLRKKYKQPFINHKIILFLLIFIFIVGIWVLALK
jgi:hypothetical protein